MNGMLSSQSIWEPASAGLLGGPPSPLFSLVARAAAANVNLRFQGYAVPVPSLVRYLSIAGPRRGPLFSLLARAATTNVTLRTRLSYMTPFIVCDWCTRERYRLMMPNSQNFPEFSADDPRILRRARDSPRIFRESRTTPRARAHHPHPQPYTSTEACCVLH